MLQFEVGVFWRDLHLDDESVDFVDDHDDSQFLSDDVFDNFFGHQHDPFDGINDQQNAVRDAKSCHQLSQKVWMSWSIDEIEDIVL